MANQVNQSLYKDNFLDKKLFINFGYFRQSDIYYTDNYYYDYDYDFFNNKNNVIYLEGEFKILSLMDKKINLYSKADYLFYNKYSYEPDEQSQNTHDKCLKIHKDVNWKTFHDKYKANSLFMLDADELEEINNDKIRY